MKKFRILLIFLLLFFVVGCGDDDEEYVREPIKITSGEEKDTEKKETNTDKKETTKKEEKETTQKNEEKEKEKEPEVVVDNYNTFTSYDNNITIKLPKDWHALTKGTLNSVAIMELGGNREDKYLMIISDYAKDIPKYEDWEKLAIEMTSKSYSYDKNNVKYFSSGKNSGKWVELNYGGDTSGVYMRIYFFRVGDNYLQLYLWTSISNKEIYRTEFDDILKTVEKKVR